MHPRSRLRLGATVLGAAALATSLVLPARPASATANATTVTVRVGTDGKGGESSIGTFRPEVTPDGRFVAFADGATQAVWLQDLHSGKATMVSVNASGEKANKTSFPVGVSADGNRVLFFTAATNLAPGPHTAADLYLRDRKANTTVRLNFAPGGTPVAVADNQAGLDEAGDVVAWLGDDAHVYSRKVSTAASQRVDVSSAEAGGNNTSVNLDLSGDGSRVAFTSYSSNLVANDTNPFADVFVRNLNAGTTAKASLGSGGQDPEKNATGASISRDGRYVTFESQDNELAPQDNNPKGDVFVRDTVSNTTFVVSLVGPSGALSEHATNPRISADGTKVFFQSTAANIAANDAPGTKNLFRRDLAASFTGTVDLSTGLNLANAAVGSSYSVNADGSTVAFASGATNLIQGDTNGRDDVFVRMALPLGPHNSPPQLAGTVLARFTGSIAGTDAVAADLRNGRAFSAGLISDLAHAPAWAKHREPVTRLYTAFFGRQPDLGGLNYWVGRRAKGTTLGPIATKFAQSSEFKNTYGNVSNQAFVTLVYQNVLDRNPDQAGLAHWVMKMGQGMSRGSVMVQFSESSEGKRLLAPSVDSTLIGLGLLGAMPKAADHSAARNAHAGFGGPAGAARWFLESSAYAATF